MENEYSVYMHVFPNTKKYIGITHQQPKKRWKNGYGYRKTSFVYNAIMKYGWDNINHIIIYKNLTKQEAEQKEIELISLYKSNQREYGYNISNGGNSMGKHSEETKKKISLKNSGINNPMYNNHKKRKKFSEEGRKNCSLSHIGKKLSEEAKAKISKKVMCIETKEIFKSIAEAERKYHCEHISNCCRNFINKTSGGYHWRYYYESD
jgi:group I intron endonuclease